MKSFASNSVRFPFHVFCSSIVLLLLTAALAPGAMAGCNKFGKGKDCASGPVTVGTAEADLTGYNAHIHGNPPLDCAGDPNSTIRSGTYDCDLADNEVHILTGGFGGIFSKKYWDICHTFHHATHDDEGRMVPDEFSYGWTDDCTDGSCTIEVRMSFSGDQVLSETDGEADQLSIVMSGSYLQGASNPFMPGLGTDTNVVVEVLEVEFGKTGRKRLVGACSWYTGLDPAQVLFTSTDSTVD